MAETDPGEFQGYERYKGAIRLPDEPWPVEKIETFKLRFSQQLGRLRDGRIWLGPLEMSWTGQAVESSGRAEDAA